MKKHNIKQKLFTFAAAMAAALVLMNVLPAQSVLAAGLAEEAGYTFTDVKGYWCPIADIPVYNLPSADSVPLGILSQGTAVSVTGMCDQNKWYRILYNGVEGYVDRIYMTVELPDKDLVQLRESFINHVVAGHLTLTDNNGNLIKDRALIESTVTLEAIMEKYDEIKYYDNYCDILFGELLVTDGFDRHTAEEIWCWINVEREQAGLPNLEWDEATYDYACKRAQEIVTNFSHDGCTEAHGENIGYMTATAANAYRLHMQWNQSPGHYSNYMDTDYTKGACAVFVYKGMAYAVENFMFY